MNINKTIETINKEIKRLTKLISSSNSHTLIKVRWNKLKKTSRLNLMLSTQHRSMIIKRQKRTLINTRYKYKTTLLRLRKVSVENYLLRKKLKYHTNFRDVSYRQLIKK